MTPPTDQTPIRTAIIGFGTGGRVFHAPLLAADPRFSVDVVVTANPERQRLAALACPDAALESTPDALFDYPDRVDLVVISTPPDSHRDLARAAIQHGLAAVVDKPFVVRPDQGRELIKEAQQHQTLLTVFQNRRYDGDFATVQGLVGDGSLGEIRSMESRFEWWKPDEPKAWKAQAGPQTGGGMLFDLGPHLLDQAFQLFGPATTVHAELTRYRPGDGGDDEAFVSLDHASGVRSHLAMSSLAPLERPRFTVTGSRAGYVKWGLDIQESQLGQGMSPHADDYGREPKDRWGRIGLREQSGVVPTEPGRYGAFYSTLAQALLHGAPPPVDPTEALTVIECIDQIYATTPITRRG
ncbi:Gfo/Idh/MocA family protein [Microlunatus ginsengisoli]|uniref:Gfo/Idh/MocA family oxidoreductase n=1 Tax=Microlunatus ginsengisoli TaxID=363863 RepID=A0ABP7AC50_9ACTN